MWTMDSFSLVQVKPAAIILTELDLVDIAGAEEGFILHRPAQEPDRSCDVYVRVVNRCNQCIETLSGNIHVRPVGNVKLNRGYLIV